MLKYIERATLRHDGPAWIANVEFSASRKTLYFNNRAFKTWNGSGIVGNYYDIENDDEYWISNPKKSGRDRHRFGRGIVFVHTAVLQEYLALRGISELDPRQYQIISNIKPTNKSRFHKLENQVVRGTRRTEKQARTNSRELRLRRFAGG